MTTIRTLTELATVMSQLANTTATHVKIVGRDGKIHVVSKSNTHKEDVELGIFRADTVRKGLHAAQWTKLWEATLRYRRLKS